MATQDLGSPLLNDSNEDPALNQAILKTNYNSYVNQGGNPNNYVINPNMLFSSGPSGGGAGGLGLYGLGGGGGASYAPYAVGNGMTRWDEFVQQMQLEQSKLKQAQDIENARLAQEKQLAEEKMQEEQKIADQNTVEAFTKSLQDQQGPKDPYGYLFNSRGLAAPQGYAPTALPLPDAVKSAYQSQGVDLAAAQKQLVGDSGPSFISGYLGSMPTPLQQGPMGFQNTPQFSGVAPGSQPQPQGGTVGPPQPSGQSPLTGGPNQPTQMAQGGVLPGFAPGRDTVPAMLSPGEGVLKPQAVQAMGGPSVVNQLNTQSPQGFADGGIVTPTANDGGFDLAGQQVGANTWENTPPPGYAMTSPGVATINPNTFVQEVENAFGGSFPINSQSQLTDAGMPRPAPIGAMPQSWNHMNSGVSTTDNSPFGSSGVMQITPQSFGPSTGSTQPIGANQAPQGLPLLTGGVLAPTAPVGQAPINLNMLDPYTRSLTDQYGRPQIPSAQALSGMPQSGIDAYQNYVEKVAGGNFQDLLDQSRQLNPQGFTPGDLRFS